MALQTAYSLFDRRQRLVALVEVRNKWGTTPEWAAEYRRNLASHGDGDWGAEFFLFATPERLYVWKGVSGAALIPPTYVVDAKPIFGPYYGKAGRAPRAAGRYAFELIVLSWLFDLTRLTEAEAAASGQGWLLESGLLPRAQNGWATYPDAA